MAKENCFVIMAIGNQKYDNIEIPEDELRAKYDDLIKEAILKAKPEIEVVRADEVSFSGNISTDIVTRIMHSTYVVADITYPNPNVFYELGLRHACKPGTIIIKEKNGPQAPFDLAHLRYIEYENTSSGLKDLAGRLKQFFDAHAKDLTRPDSHFLELAKLTKYKFPNYVDEPEMPKETEIMLSLLQSPEIIDMMTRQQSGEQITPAEFMKIFSKNPKIAEPFITAMVKSGDISFESQGNRASRRKPKRGAL